MFRLTWFTTVFYRWVVKAENDNSKVQALLPPVDKTAGKTADSSERRQIFKPMKESKTLSSVIQDMRDREELGKNKYGTTVDRKDLSPRQWMQHHYEELLDAALYVKRQIMILDGQEQAKVSPKASDWVYDVENAPCGKIVNLLLKDGTEIFGWVAHRVGDFYTSKNRLAINWKINHDVVAWKEIQD